MGDPIPIIVLGGSDREPAEMPELGRDKHPLSGYKGVDVRFEGRTLVETVTRRFSECGHFRPIYIAGPVTIYEPVCGGTPVIDTDGSFGQNIRKSLEWVRARHPGSPIGFTTCDVLPDASSLQTLMQHYEQHRPCDLWFPLIRIPPDRGRLGASGWKPSYRIVPRKGQPPVEILPGHLIIVDPGALRLDLVYRLFELSYRTRNRSIGYRLVVLLRGLLAGTLRGDLLALISLRLPDQTWTLLWTALPGARALKAGTLTRLKMESALRSIFMSARHRRRHPERRVLLPILEGLSLALDIDTEEEARAMGGALSDAPQSRDPDVSDPNRIKPA